MVAGFGLLGNFLSFIILSTQEAHKTFHNLLLLLSIFDMVNIQSYRVLSDTGHSAQVYLVTAVCMFALPRLFVMAELLGTFHLLSLPIILPIAHIGMVRLW